MWKGSVSAMQQFSNKVDMEPLLLCQEAASSSEKQSNSPNAIDFGNWSTSTGMSTNTATATSTVMSQSSSVTPVMEESIMIDNSTRTYHSFQLECGVSVQCAPQVLARSPMVLRSLQIDLHHILNILPWSVHELVKRTTIWVNDSYAYGSKDDPKVLRHATTHHHEGWLIHCAHDIPQKTKSIEIYSCDDYQRMRLHWNGCGFLLHEFCHLIHQCCLGLDYPPILDLYQQACASGKYDCVVRRDWAGFDEDYDQAYATVDHKEFFAELSVAFLSKGYAELDTAECTRLEECSPPLLLPDVSQRFLIQRGLQNRPIPVPARRPALASCLMPWNKTGISSLSIIDGPFQERALAKSCEGVEPCNKFYPFTHGQLRHSDRVVFEAMKFLWTEITLFDDPIDDRTVCRSLRKWLPSFR